MNLIREIEKEKEEELALELQRILKYSVYPEPR